MSGPKFNQTLPQIEGLAASGVCTVRLPLGRTYHEVALLFGNIALSEITDIKVMANGKAIHTWATGTDLDAWNVGEGRSSVGSGDFTAPLKIYFDTKGVRTIDGEKFTALGTGIADDPTPVVNLYVEFTTTGATGVTLTAYAVQSGAQLAGIIKHTKKFSYYPTAAGEFEISDLPRGALIRRVWFNSSVVTAVKLEVDGFTRFDRPAAVNDSLLAEDGYRADPGTGYMVDFAENGDGAASLATRGINDMRFKLTCSGSGTVPVYVEYLDVLGR